ncbi:MAG: S-layer homology domain-containing protein, partial [Candidatus Peregrinibacteria bacterium]
GTQAFVTMGGSDYFGQDRPEPVCVNNGQSVSKNIVLGAASGGGTVSVPITVKLVKSGGFGGANIDIFAGGPGRSVVKTISNVTTPDASGYTIYLPSNGFWNVGVGPSMPKSASGGKPDFETFGGMPPQPIGLEVTGLPSSGAVDAAWNTPANVSWNNTTDILTFTVPTNNIEIPVQVTDGTNGLANVDVFMHQQGFGQGAFGTTNSTGTVTLKVADYGPYEIGASKPGLGETFQNVDIRNESGTVIYYKGASVLIVPLKIKKRDYYISGKVLDSSGNGIAWAPVWADDGSGTIIHGGTDSSGAYTLYVSAGTWTVRSELPPDKTASCDTFSLSVTITNASKASQNVQPTSGTCYTLSGTVTVNGSLQANKHVFVEAWDATNSRPSGGFHRDSNTNSSGAYNIQIPAGTYRVGTWDQDYGELGETTTVDANKTVDLNSGTLETTTFAFTGGAAGMNGFIEMKGTSDKNLRIGKPFNGLGSSLTMNTKAGTFNYFVDIFGIGKYTGTVTAGATATIDLTGKSLITLSGTVYDSEDNAVPRAKVKIDDFTNNIHRDVTAGDNGTYSTQINAGTYDVTVKRAEYVAGQAPESLALTENTANYDFGGNNPDQSAMVASTDTISGILYESDGTTPITDAHIWAVSSTGQVVSTQLKDSTDGTYTLPVTNDTSWTVKAIAPLNGETTLGSTVNTVDAIADTGKNITLTADATKIPKSTSSNFTATSSIAYDDSDNSDMKLVASGSTLATTGTVTVSMEKSYMAPSSDNFTPVDGVSFDLNVTSSGSAVKDFPGGNAELVLEYDSSELPAGITESDLNVVYYDQSSDTYVPCEGGVTIDSANDTATCRTDHATTFSIVYPTSSIRTSSGGSSSQQIVAMGTTGAAAVDVVNTVANTTTNPISNTVRQTITNGGTLYQPLQFSDNLVSLKAGAKHIQFTGENAELILKPSTDATVAVEFAADTEITASLDWEGDLQPPVVQPKSVVQEDSDYEVEGAKRTLTQSEVETVVSLGSSTSMLTLSRPATVKVPVNLTEGDIVEVYSSEDGLLWERLSGEGVYIVTDGEVSFSTDHFTYFAVVPTGESIIAEEEAVELKGVAEEIPVIEIPFVDLKSHWSTEYVSKLYGLDIIGGKTPTRFAPDETITRAELAKMAVLAFGYEVPATVYSKPFKDVETTVWYAPYVQVAKEQGLITGYSNGRFRPDWSINRAEALKILLGAAGVDLPEVTTAPFRDISTQAWYAKYIQYAKNNNIISGFSNDTFRPGNNLTRAEAAKIIVKILEM